MRFGRDIKEALSTLAVGGNYHARHSAAQGNIDVPGLIWQRGHDEKLRVWFSASGLGGSLVSPSSVAAHPVESSIVPRPSEAGPRRSAISIEDRPFGPGRLTIDAGT